MQELDREKSIFHILISNNLSNMITSEKSFCYWKSCPNYCLATLAQVFSISLSSGHVWVNSSRAQALWRQRQTPENSAGMSKSRYFLAATQSLKEEKRKKQLVVKGISNMPSVQKHILKVKITVDMLCAQKYYKISLKILGFTTSMFCVQI